MSLRGQIIVTSLTKALDKAKSTGHADLTVVMIYDMYYHYLSFTQDKEEFVEEHKALREAMDGLLQNYPKALCSYKTTGSRNIKSVDIGKTVVQLSGNLTNPVVSSFSTTTLIDEPLFGAGANYSTHKFTTAEFEAVYSDMNSDTQFDTLVIDTADLSDGSLKRTVGLGGYVVGEGSGKVYIPYSDVANWAWFTNNVVNFSNPINFQLIDKVGSIDLESNVATMTINRTAVGNQPATVGDSYIEVGNNVTTIITTAMVTSGLTPPYNDPEGDLVDAIRIKEISTANQGVFYFNGVPLAVNDVITKAELDANLFTHQGPNTNSIASDVIRFEVRDAGSLIWVE